MLDPAQLLTVAAIVREGSFERAARVLAVTPSALSQRVRALEERLGSVLVVRGSPCRATPLGAALCRHAERVALMEQDLLAAWPGDTTGAGADHAVAPLLRVAVNADSLATWFVPALARAADRVRVQFDVTVDDQDHTAALLRRGEVMAGVTGTAAPVQGFRCEPLGLLRYVATASPAFMARHFPAGVDAAALARAPMLSFSPKDQLQDRFIRRVTRKPLRPPLHRLPSTQAFVDAARCGLGWGMNPEALVAPHLTAGALVALRPDAVVDVALYWQRSTLPLQVLEALTEAVRQAAAEGLRRPVARRA